MTSTKGLEGVVATQSAISSIIDDTLTYVGYDIDDLAENASFEEVIYLLWHQRLPKEDELVRVENNSLQTICLYLRKYSTILQHIQSEKYTRWRHFVRQYLY